MSVNFISDDKLMIDRNGIAIASLMEQYSPSSLFVTNNTRVWEAVGSRSGFGAGNFRLLTSENITDDIEARSIGEHTDVFATFQSTKSPFNFPMTPLAMLHEVSDMSAGEDLTNVFNGAIKGLYVGWDKNTYVTLFQDENAGKYTLEPYAGVITIESLLLSAQQAYESFRDNLNVTVDNGMSINVQVDSIVSAVLKQPNADGTQLNQVLFSQALGGAGYTVLNKKIADNIKNELGMELADGLVVYSYSPNIYLHHGKLPQIFDQRETENLTVKYYFGHNNAKFQVFNKSVFVAHFDVA